MELTELVSILSGSMPRTQELAGCNFKGFQAVEFPPRIGSIWSFRNVPKDQLYSNRVLVTGVSQAGQWNTITVVTDKGVTAGDFINHDAWAEVFVPFDDPT